MTEFTSDAVADHLALPAGDPQRAMLAGPVAATAALVRRWCAAGADPAEWPADITEGAVMLAARLHRRRNSPAGVESFNELGAVYVQRNDPDIAMLLGIGAYLPPRIG